MPDLLLELFSEEIPARMQARASADLRRLVTEGLVEAGLTYASAGAFATPRRLVLSVEGLSAASSTLREERKGPRVDAPDKALAGFLRATGLSREALEQRESKKGRVWFAVSERPGRKAAEIVAEVVAATVRGFPWPKSMRWGAGTLRWVRPLHSILCLLSDEAGASVVPLEIDGIPASDSTEGHRFMSPDLFSVMSFEDYRAKLQRAHVLLDAADRAARIRADAKIAAFAHGLELVEDAGLLAELAGLVEWPVVLIGEIGADYLDLPPEVLQTSMRTHQKFFSVKNPKTGRIERFITVANRETADEGATILKGNRKVLAARLADAKFFWENDLRVVHSVGMEGMAAGLEHVTFHNKLGSQADRIKRIEALAREIAPIVGADPELAAEAARVVKADLQSAMVGEFPELQGTMGGYYARAAGLPEAVAQACKEHYQPLGPADTVPTAPVSVAVALADKIDTLTGFWAIDEKPTGSKDPFALRRAALGVIRLVLENGVRATLREWMSLAWQETLLQRCAIGEAFTYDKQGKPIESLKVSQDVKRRKLNELQNGETVRLHRGVKADVSSNRYEVADVITYLSLENVVPDLLAFLHDRLKVHLRAQNIRHDVIDACLAMPNNDDLTLLVKRARALQAFLDTDDGENLLQGFKRANNILTQAEAKDGVEYSYGAEAKLAQTPEEKALFAALDAAEPVIATALGAEDFTAAMAAMAALRTPIDAFFEAVQINAKNEILRRNRLNLLNRIRATCLAVADLTRLEG